MLSFLLVPTLVSADVIMTYFFENPFVDLFLIFLLFILFIALLEVLCFWPLYAYFYENRIKFLKSFWIVFVANFVTAIFGGILQLFSLFPIRTPYYPHGYYPPNYHFNPMNFLILFTLSVLIEFLVYLLFLKVRRKDFLFIISIVANFLTYVLIGLYLIASG